MYKLQSNNKYLGSSNYLSEPYERGFSCALIQVPWLGDVIADSHLSHPLKGMNIAFHERGIKPVIHINCHEGVEGAQQKKREEARSAYFAPALLRIAMFI